MDSSGRTYGSGGSSQGGSGASGSGGKTNDSGAGGEIGGESGSNQGGAESHGGSAGNAGAAGETTQVTGGAGGSSAGAGGGGGEPPVCSAELLESSVTGSTVNGEDRFAPSCAPGRGNDLAFRFTAPATDYYRFTTRGSNFDTVLSLRDGTCDGAELACNNNDGASAQSKIVVQLEQGSESIVVVDGQLGAKGTVELAVEAVTCPSLDLTDQTLPAELTTQGASNEPHDGGCGGETLSEQAVRWRASEAGLYRFSASSSIFGPALYLEDGPECGGSLRQCNFNVVNGYPAQVTRWLNEGEVVTLIVDGKQGMNGLFNLDVEKLPSACPSQPALAKAAANMVRLDDSTGKTLLSSSCNWAGNRLDSRDRPFPEHSYPVHVALKTDQFCAYYLTSDSPVSVYVLEGASCDGREVLCQAQVTEYEWHLDESKNGDYVLVVEDASSFHSGAVYSLTTDCM